jgi:KUP system potassium uptake protein
VASIALSRPLPRTRRPEAALMLGALGVVFGDIGTSPLYALGTVFSRDADRPVPVDVADVYGVISLVFWSLTIVVTLKYVVLVMRADNDGEGGIMALIALLRRLRPRDIVARRRLTALAVLGIFGASLFFGDSMITPAISVLSAVEGLKVVDPGLAAAVVPIAAVVLFALFALQRHGTGVVGKLFGPVCGIWFVALAVLGVRGIAAHPAVLEALSPSYAVAFFTRHGLTAFLALGGVVLVVTGAEALYADLGHFGRGPINRAWLLIVFPALILNYLGQSAYLVKDPANAANPFYALVPHWAQIPMVLLATAATVIASQAVISGAFSITRQAIQLGYLPRLRVRHPSPVEGQVYVPFVNWLLLAAVLALVLGFRHSSSLAYAYGIAVTGTFSITTVLFFVVAHLRWRLPLPLAICGATVFLIVELAFLGANAVKVVSGGWLPLAVGAIVFAILVTWHQGRAIVTRNREALEGRLRDFVRALHTAQLRRTPGTAVFLSRGSKTTPLALRALVQHTHTLPERVLILSIETEPVPYVADTDRVDVNALYYDDDGITHLTARFGFLETPDVPRIVDDQGGVSYFLSKISLTVGDDPAMARWRKRVFLALSRLAADPIDYFVLPRDRTVLMGAHVEI